MACRLPHHGNFQVRDCMSLHGSKTKLTNLLASAELHADTRSPAYAACRPRACDSRRLVVTTLKGLSEVIRVARRRLVVASSAPLHTAEEETAALGLVDVPGQSESQPWPRRNWAKTRAHEARVVSRRTHEEGTSDPVRSSTRARAPCRIVRRHIPSWYFFFVPSARDTREWRRRRSARFQDAQTHNIPRGTRVLLTISFSQQRTFAASSCLEFHPSRPWLR